MTENIPVETALEQARGFRWGHVPAVRGGDAARFEADAEPVSPEPDLGGIAGFTGVFKGTGLNTIFRPQNFALTPTPLPNPAKGNDDNILEVNLTEETLSFSAALGSIPNRGMVQGDVFLNGIPYLQTINDVSDPAQPVGIHFEPGVWLSVPATTAPTEGATLVRMASIPHGTTITAQGTSFAVPGGPRIDPVDITPFLIGSTPPRLIRFPSQDVNDTETFRLPQDLTTFIADGTITQEILDNPNLILKTRADAQNITATTVILISTNPDAPLFGGGTDNIAFLLGDPTSTAPNADATQMTAIFWIETVSEQITVPPCGPYQPVIVQGSASAGSPVASFAVTSATEITEETQIDVTYTQIQYTQTVFLDFNGLTWPHVSVATLVPNDPVPVTL
ncbi:MAG TPA: heme-binding protein [Kineosporiaceae bacterium]|nr:heme-binding protein [Kineosporiaceae bacterium]